MSEYLSFNKCGQWELHKATNFNDADSTPPKNINEGPHDKPFKVYRGNAKDGELHADFNQRGMLHDHNGGLRPKAQRINWKNVGKPSQPLDSVYAEHNPGVGVD